MIYLNTKKLFIQNRPGSNISNYRDSTLIAFKQCLNKISDSEFHKKCYFIGAYFLHFTGC